MISIRLIRGTARQPGRGAPFSFAAATPGSRNAPIHERTMSSLCSSRGKFHAKSAITRVRESCVCCSQGKERFFYNYSKSASLRDPASQQVSGVWAGSPWPRGVWRVSRSAALIQFSRGGSSRGGRLYFSTRERSALEYCSGSGVRFRFSSQTTWMVSPSARSLGSSPSCPARRMR